MGIFQQLRERRLVQIAVSYLVAAWLFMQIFDQLADRGIIPELAYRVALIWAILGIPVSLLIGWHHGEKGKQKAPLSEIALIAVIAVLALGLSASSVTQEWAAQLEESARLAARDNVVDVRHIAVTYFVDRTGGEYEYLADALTEDLIAQLSQIDGLSVVSRNGVLPFKGTDTPIDSVARALRTGAVIDGAVERDGSRLRYTIQLRDHQGVRLGGTSFVLEAEEAVGARDSVTQQTVRMLRPVLGDELRARQAAAATSSNAAWVLLQRAEKMRKDAEAAYRAGDEAAGTRLFMSADTLLAQAADLDRNWPEPPTNRAWIAYRRARFSDDVDQHTRLIDEAMSHVDEAFRRSNTHARAYEARGTIRYWQAFGMKAAPDRTTEDAWISSAVKDLEAATRFDRLLASAYGSLSFILSGDDPIGAVTAAQRAYEADAYLENAPVVLRRLFQGVLDQGSYPKAREWCEEGVRRFPQDHLVQSCQLRLMVTPAVARPDIDEAWRIAALLHELAPPNQKQREQVQNQMIVAGVIARAGSIEMRLPLVDSAQAVLERAAAAVTPDIDPSRELLAIEAYSWLLLGDRDRAVMRLEQHAMADPQRYARSNEGVSWWWRDLEGHPRFRSLMGLP
jgi:TolB-like protein